MTEPQETYFRKGLGAAAIVQGELEAAYADALVDRLRANDYRLVVGDLTILLAREFGFCYGVERAVDYAYQARRRFPDRRLWLLGEIIHNPHVNERLRDLGIQVMEPRVGATDGTPRFDYAAVDAADVVILPAFGVTYADFRALRAHGCVVVDTTCGSVLNVWKRVEQYARDARTALIHGKWYHEETRATASQVLKYPGGHYLVVRDMPEAEVVMTYIEAVARHGHGDRDAFMARFERAVSPGFDPDLHLRRIGVANQTTMLAKESLAIGEQVGQALEAAYGADHRAEAFRTFDTICSATQDRQDAVLDVLAAAPDVMLVVGGFNSSNTISLAALCAERVRTYHMEDAEGIDPVTGRLHYRVAGVAHVEAEAEAWLPAGPVTVGITAGASTPNNKIGAAVARVLATRGERVPGS
ncbi:MAG: 4-hydroxy-3-methylbut-2-enyl diphosphate reductase [Gemmatimonadetes bacterium]|nr:4-hydroxy-3-methylbut-2-enyl diphosphate reductase [Gemmatimonadota bacterium]